MKLMTQNDLYKDDAGDFDHFSESELLELASKASILLREQFEVLEECMAQLRRRMS